MKINIIGAGGVAQAHLKAIQALKNLELTNIYDIDYEQAKKTALKFGGTPSKNLEEITESCDALIIASPNHCHALHSIEALRHSKHILCEKPMSTSLVEAEKMLCLAQRQKVVASLGFNYRYLPIIREIKKLLHKNFFSEIIHFSIEFKRSSALTRKKYTWRDSQESLFTSGAMGDLGSHLIDIIIYLFKVNFDYSSFKVNIKTNIPRKENKKVYVDDFCHVYGRLESGTYFDLLASKSALPEEAGLFIHIISSKNELYYTSQDPETYYTKASYFWTERKLPTEQHLGDSEGEVKGWSNSFYYQLKDWIDQIQGVISFPQIASFSDGFFVQRALYHVLQKPV